jgi:hypothetical protein
MYSTENIKPVSFFEVHISEIITDIAENQKTM